MINTIYTIQFRLSAAPVSLPLSLSAHTFLGSIFILPLNASSVMAASAMPALTLYSNLTESLISCATHLHFYFYSFYRLSACARARSQSIAAVSTRLFNFNMRTCVAMHCDKFARYSLKILSNVQITSIATFFSFIDRSGEFVLPIVNAIGQIHNMRCDIEIE